MNDEIDLTIDYIEIETFADGNALGCFSTATSAGTASCPATSASTLTTGSSYSA